MNVLGLVLVFGILGYDLVSVLKGKKVNWSERRTEGLFGAGLARFAGPAVLDAGGAADPIQLMKLYDKIFPYPTFCVKIVEIWIICCACEGNGHFTNNNVTGKGNLYEGLLL